MASDWNSGNVPMAFTEGERQLVDKVVAWLQEFHPDDISVVTESFSRLGPLGDAVFAYPSIRHTQFLRDSVFDKGHLVDSLLAFSSSSQLLRIPTKVVVMRSFLVAKFHSFSLLSNLTLEKKDYHEDVRKIVFSVISTMIAEAVYFSCLDDPLLSRDIKANLAGDLVDLWDSGVDHRGLRNFSALASLWRVRNSSPPNFGTMDGNTELLRLTMDLDEEWRVFLVEESGNNETRWALEEFLFGLSWEEIQKIRRKLASKGTFAVGLDGIRDYLDLKPAFMAINEDDPRTFYDFFIDRRDACNLRKKLSSSGPTFTLEEIYLKYRIAAEQL